MWKKETNKIEKWILPFVFEYHWIRNLEATHCVFIYGLIQNKIITVSTGLMFLGFPSFSSQLCLSVNLKRVSTVLSCRKTRLFNFITRPTCQFFNQRPLILYFRLLVIQVTLLQRMGKQVEENLHNLKVTRARV